MNSPHQQILFRNLSANESATIKGGSSSKDYKPSRRQKPHRNPTGSTTSLRCELSCSLSPQL